MKICCFSDLLPNLDKKQQLDNHQCPNDREDYPRLSAFIGGFKYGGYDA